MAPVLAPHGMASRALRVPAAAVPHAAAHRSLAHTSHSRPAAAQRVLTWRDVAHARPSVACHATVASAETSTDDDLAKLRALGSWADWLKLAGGVHMFSPNEGYAAVRKVSELARKNPKQYSELPDSVRAEISVAIENVFERLGGHALDLSIGEQQILTMEISQLGNIFTSNAWRQHCPTVPVKLLNSLLDSLLNNLRKLRGDQVGMVMTSLNKLHLRDREAFDRITDVVSDQLASPGKNSWYMRTEPLSMLMHGVVSVFLAIPNNMSVETAEGLLSRLLTSLAGLDEEQWNDSSYPWHNVASVFDTLALLPASVKPPDADVPLKALADRFVSEAPEVPPYSLSQLARGFSSVNFKHPEGLKFVTEIWRRGKQEPGFALTAVEVAEAHARMPAPDKGALKEIMTWVLANADDESQARVATAAQRAGALEAGDWDQVKGVCSGLLKAGVRFTTAVDRQSERLLQTALLRGDERVVEAVLSNVVTWGTNRLLRLWRLSPYLQLMAVAPPSALSRELFDVTVPDVPKLAHPSVYMINRAGHLAGVLGACVAAGRKDHLMGLLQVQHLPQSFADVGGDQEGIALGLLALSEGTIGDGELKVTPEVTEAAETLWTAITKRGRLESMSHRALLGAAVGLTRCEVPASVWVNPIFASLQEPTRPKVHEMNLEMLLPIAESPWFQDTGSSNQRSIIIKFLRQGGIEPPTMKPRGHLSGKRAAASDAESASEAESSSEAEAPPARATPKPAAAAAPAATAAEPANDFASLKVADLKAECKARKLKVSGTKKELVARLEKHADGGDATEAEASESEPEPVPEPEPTPEPVAEAAPEPEPVAAEAAGGGASEAELKKLTIPQLKDVLRGADLKLTGKKAELVERCLEAGLSP